MSRAPLRIAVLGAGTVGLEVIRAFEAFPSGWLRPTVSR
jgi:homoserine dehydrogenase